MSFATYNAASVLVSSALKNFNKATDILKENHKKEYHIAVSKGGEFHQDHAEAPENHRYSKINPDQEKSEAAAQYHLAHSLLQ